MEPGGRRREAKREVERAGETQEARRGLFSTLSTRDAGQCGSLDPALEKSRAREGNGRKGKETVRVPCPRAAETTPKLSCGYPPPLAKSISVVFE